MQQTIAIAIILLSSLAFASDRYHPADTNQNKIIEQSEFDNYNQAWRSDKTWPSTGESVPTNFLTRAGHLLLNGGKYQDSGGDTPMCWVPGQQAVPAIDFTNTIGMTFVYIEPGSYIMGSPLIEPGRDNNEIQRQVTLTKGYYMQTTEVTQGQWKAVMGSNPSYFDNCGDNCPVETVSWTDAQEFITALNEKEKTSLYRLPTEAEWEYAARSGSTTAFANGDLSDTGCGFNPNLNIIGWYCGNANGKTHPVAQKQANVRGLDDMHGNVSEWCNDWYDSYPSNAVTDPGGPTSGASRVVRGGCWGDLAQSCRSAARNSNRPDGRNQYIGLRLLKMLKP